MPRTKKPIEETLATEIVTPATAKAPRRKKTESSADAPVAQNTVVEVESVATKAPKAPKANNKKLVEAKPIETESPKPAVKAPKKIGTKAVAKTEDLVEQPVAPAPRLSLLKTKATAPIEPAESPFATIPRKLGSKLFIRNDSPKIELAVERPRNSNRNQVQEPDPETFVEPDRVAPRTLGNNRYLARGEGASTTVKPTKTLAELIAESGETVDPDADDADDMPIVARRLGAKNPTTVPEQRPTLNQNQNQNQNQRRRDNERPSEPAEQEAPAVQLIREYTFTSEVDESGEEIPMAVWRPLSDSTNMRPLGSGRNQDRNKRERFKRDRNDQGSERDVQQNQPAGAKQPQSEDRDGARNDGNRRRKLGTTIVSRQELSDAPLSEPVQIDTTGLDLMEGEELPMPSFRAVSAIRPARQESIAPKERPRRGRRIDSEGVESEEEPTFKTEEDDDALIVPEFRPRTKERIRLAAPPRALIEIPDDAPQVVMRAGVPTLTRNRRVYPTFFFHAAPSDDQRFETVIEEIRQAAEAGVHLHALTLDFVFESGSANFTAQRALTYVRRIAEIDPAAQVLFKLKFNFPGAWEEKYPSASYRLTNGKTGGPSLSDDDFWKQAIELLVGFTKTLRSSDLNGNILGIHLDQNPWLHASATGFDRSQSALQKFKNWVRERYVDDEVILRSSWFDGSANFNNIELPRYESTLGGELVRRERKQRNLVDFQLFMSDQTVARIADIAYAVKEASDGYFLIGLSYGYTLEYTHPTSGHLSLGKILRTPEIDFLSGPVSYESREPGSPAGFPCPVDSILLNGKLYLAELDYKTSLSRGGIEPDTHNPIMRTPQMLESVHTRDLGAALSHGSGMVWSDAWGNGWLTTTSVWERAKKFEDVLVRRMATALSDPDIAVFIDERALAYLNDTEEFRDIIHDVRDSVLRSGVSAGFYLLSDLTHREHFPESKLYIFVNAWDIRSDTRSAIKTRLQRDKKVLFWLYTSGLFDAGRESLERVREVTGIALKPQPIFSKPGTTILDRRHTLAQAFPNGQIHSETQLEPSYFAIPEDGHVVGEYSQTGLPSFVVRNVKGETPDLDWTSVFLGEPVMNTELIRALAQLAKAHVWSFQEDVVHIRAPYLTIHCKGDGQRTVALPARWSAFNLLTNDWTVVDTNNLRFHGTDGSNHVYLVGTKEDIQSILERNPSELLRMENLPPRESNVRVDVSKFDVPIVRLDEWISGAESTDVIDEWFLRPREEEPEEESSGSDENAPGHYSNRRNNRRRRTGRSGGRYDAPPVSGEVTDVVSVDMGGDFDLQVSFRKKD